MKRILSIFLICAMTIGISAQKKTAKKQPKKSSGKATMVDIAGVTDAVSDKSEADTLKLKAGKAYVILIDVAPNMKGVSVGGDDQEKNELIKNFRKTHRKLSNYTLIPMYLLKMVNILILPVMAILTRLLLTGAERWMIIL